MDIASLISRVMTLKVCLVLVILKLVLISALSQSISNLILVNFFTLYIFIYYIE